MSHNASVYLNEVAVVFTDRSGCRNICQKAMLWCTGMRYCHCELVFTVHCVNTSKQRCKECVLLSSTIANTSDSVLKAKFEAALARGRRNKKHLVSYSATNNFQVSKYHEK